MSQWNPQQYLLFRQQRTQPAIDLVNRLQPYSPATVVDIGCGPGNSTSVLQKAFPHAAVVGIDSSLPMIQKARAEYSNLTFEEGDAQSLTGHYDLLFSNACLQWIPHHEQLIPQLMQHVNPNGILAVQIPMNQSEPLFCIIREVARQSRFHFESVHFEQNDSLSPREYYNILSDCSDHFDMWETVYYHKLPSHAHLLEWVRSTRLRPYLDCLNQQEQQFFEACIMEKAKKAYPLTPKGEVIFPFKRFFFLAYQ